MDDNPAVLLGTVLCDFDAGERRLFRRHFPAIELFSPLLHNLKLPFAMKTDRITVLFGGFDDSAQSHDLQKS